MPVLERLISFWNLWKAFVLTVASIGFMSAATFVMPQQAIAVPQEFAITFDGKGKVSGVIEDFALKGGLNLEFEGEVELSDLASTVLGRKVIYDKGGEKIHISLSSIRMFGKTLVLRGKGRYEHRGLLRFNIPGTVELRLAVKAVRGKPFVYLTRSDIEFDGLLGRLARLLNIDDMVEDYASPIIQAAINKQIKNRLAKKYDKISGVMLRYIRFISYESGKYGIAFDALIVLKTS